MSEPVIAIVTGSRHWTDREAIERAIFVLPDRSLVVHGDCNRDLLECTGRRVGADMIADEMATARGLEVRRFPADWRLGKKAGPLRNRKIRDAALKHEEWSGWPVVCLAFPLPQSKGTLDMIALCEAEGWEVRRG